MAPVQNEQNQHYKQAFTQMRARFLAFRDMHQTLNKSEMAIDRSSELSGNIDSKMGSSQATVNV
jgi:hypothetical protein